MAISWLVSSSSVIAINGTITYVSPIGSGGDGQLSTEAQAQYRVRDTLTWDYLTVRCYGYFGGPYTVKSRVNGADGNQAVAITGTGIFQDTTHSDSLVNDDLIDVLIPSATSLSAVVGSRLTHATDEVPPLGGGNNGTFDSALYFAIGGRLQGAGTEASSQTTFRTATTLSKLRVYVSANTEAKKTADILLRVNGANGNNSVTIPAASTGEFQDTTSTDSISAGDEVNYFFDPAGGFAGAITLTLAQMKSAGNVRFLCVDGYYSFSASSYYPMEGYYHPTGIESNMQIYGLTTFVLKNLCLTVISNTVSSASTLKLRKNGADGNLSITIPATSTGIFEDVVNTDTIGATDLINYYFDKGAVGTALVCVTKIEADYEVPVNVGYQDIATRFKLIARSYQDIATRFKLTVRNFKDIATRFKLTVRNYLDIDTRFQLTVQAYQDTVTRFKLTVRAFQDIATRFKVTPRNYTDANTRFKLTSRLPYPIIGGGHIIKIVE